jgi:hypothetical protein
MLRARTGEEGPRRAADSRQLYSLGADDTIRIWRDDLPTEPEALRAWLNAVDAPELEDD